MPPNWLIIYLNFILLHFFDRSSSPVDHLPRLSRPRRRPGLRGADRHARGRGAHLGQHLLRHGAALHHAALVAADELAALAAGHPHPLVRGSRLLEVPLLWLTLEVALLLLLLLQVDRAVPLLVLLLHLLLGVAHGLRHLLRSHALLLLLLHHHALLGLPLVRHALHLHLRLALGLLARHHLGSSLSPALSRPGARLAPLLVLLLLLRSLLDERGHQARVAFQNAEDLLVLLLGLRALEDLLEGELDSGSGTDLGAVVAIPLASGTALLGCCY